MFILMWFVAKNVAIKGNINIQIKYQIGENPLFSNKQEIHTFKQSDVKTEMSH